MEAYYSSLKRAKGLNKRISLRRDINNNETYIFKTVAGNICNLVNKEKFAVQSNV